MSYAVDFEFEVLCEVGKRYGVAKSRLKCLELSHPMFR